MLTLIKNAKLVNEGQVYQADVLIKNQIIKEISNEITIETDYTIDAKGLHLLPGVIDDQVHFREPGLTHKANIYSESKAAVAGGITSFMEMPNTNPQALTQELLEDKYVIASQNSIANYSFFMGASNNNLEEVLKTDPKKVVIFDSCSFLIEIFLVGTKFKSVGSKVKVIINDVIKPKVIIHPKSIIGLIPLKINDKKANTVVSTV